MVVDMFITTHDTMKQKGTALSDGAVSRDGLARASRNRNLRKWCLFFAQETCDTNLFPEGTDKIQEAFKIRRQKCKHSVNRELLALSRVINL